MNTKTNTRKRKGNPFNVPFLRVKLHSYSSMIINLHLRQCHKHIIRMNHSKAKNVKVNSFSINLLNMTFLFSKMNSI